MRKYFSLDYKYYRGGAVEDTEAGLRNGLGVDDSPSAQEEVRVQTQNDIKALNKVPDLTLDEVLQVKAEEEVESNSTYFNRLEKEDKILEEVYASFPKFFPTVETVLFDRFAKGELTINTFTVELCSISYCYRQLFYSFCDKLGIPHNLELDTIKKRFSNGIRIFDYYEGSKTYALVNITEQARKHREKIALEVKEKEQKKQEGTYVEEVTSIEQEVNRVLDTDDKIEWKVEEPESQVEIEQADTNSELEVPTEESMVTEPDEEDATSISEELEIEYDDLETSLEKKAEAKAANKKKKSKTKASKPVQKQERVLKKKKKKVEKNNFFGNDFSVARDKNVLFYFVGKIENQVNLLNAIECKTGAVYSIRDLNQRVRKNTGCHLQYTKEKVLIQDNTSVSSDCRYLLLNLSLTGKVSDLPLYILFFRNASNARFICQGRVESLDAYKAHILNPYKDIQIVKNTLVENILKEPKTSIKAESLKEGLQVIQDKGIEKVVEKEDLNMPDLETQTSVDDMISITDIDTMTEEWIQSEKSESKYSKAGSATLNYSTYIGRRPQVARCNVTIGVSSNFYRTLGNRMLPCWLSDNVYKCNIFLEILLGRFESKFFLKELTSGVHYLRNSKHTYYIINSGLVDVFGNDIFFSFKCTRAENKVHFSCLDIVTSIKSAQTLNFNISLLELYQLKAISLWDKGTEYFDAKMEDFDFLSMERLLHVTQERSYRYPSTVSKLSVDRLFTYIKDSIKIAVRLSKVDAEYVKPIFYPCDVTRLEYFIPVHIFTNISEQPELGVIVNKDPDGIWNVMTVLPYEVLLTNHRMLTIYSSRGRC